MTKKIGVFPLVLLIVCAIDTIRNLPSTALFGSSLIFFLLFSALFFLIPLARVITTFSTHFLQEKGLFHWIDKTWGENVAFIAVWLQWSSTVVWFPTVLSFFAATVAYLINPALAQNRDFLLFVMLFTFWGITLLTIRGMHVTARVNFYCGLIGLIIPMTVLIISALVWVLLGHEIEFAKRDFLPSWTNMRNWCSLVAIMTSLIGIDLAGVYLGKIEQPEKNFPRAMIWSIGTVLLILLLGSLSISTVIPQSEIHLVDGLMQTFTRFFSAFGIEFIAPLMTLLITLVVGASMFNWLIAPAKGLSVAAELGFVPSYFSKENLHGSPARALIAQGTVTSISCLVLYLIPSINGFYWFLTALSTSLYMWIYGILFSGALKLGKNSKWICLSGFLTCNLTTIFAFVPPKGVDVGGTFYYCLLVAGAKFLLVSPALLIIRRRNKKKLIPR